MIHRIRFCFLIIRSTIFLGGRVFVIGGGKAAGLMAETLEEIIGGVIQDGIVNCKKGNFKTKRIKIVEAGHPIPNKEGLEGVAKMLNFYNKYSISREDLVLCLISGGGSSLMPQPAEGLSLFDVQKTNKLLINCGAEINEINIVRKHLSKIKGGRLARFFYPARVISLILSDIVNGELSSVASGPTIKDSSTFFDALFVLKKYNLDKKVPSSIINFLEKGDRGEIEETPKSLKKVNNYIIGDNKIALRAAKRRARKLGFNPCIINVKQKGDPSITAKLRAEEIKQGKYRKYDFLIIGGETSPVLPKKHGIGGRNQHYVATSIIELKDYKKEWLVASMSTDGADFSIKTAGAIADNNSAKKIKELNIDVNSYLINYDSNNLFKRIGNCLIKTGNTGTNVGDIILYVI
jgi:glycerate 2-kinase